jgi:hypothetical protein
MVGTLLGPEASGPHARVASVVQPCGLCGGCVGCVGLCFWLSLLCLVVSLCGGGGGLVGLLFEICIVDASIN